MLRDSIVSAFQGFRVCTVLDFCILCIKSVEHFDTPQPETQNTTELQLDTELHPDLKCMDFLHYFPLKVQQTNDVEKKCVCVGGADYFYQSGKHERRRHLILDILKAPEVHCSF